jgi:hypothetical protein
MMNDEINLLQKIKIDEYNFKEKFIKNIQGDDNKILDLDYIIECNSKIKDSKNQELMPWCNVVSDFQFDKCKNLYTQNYDFNDSQKAQVKKISDEIIEIVEKPNINNDELKNKKDELNNLYKAIFNSTYIEPPQHEGEERNEAIVEELLPEQLQLPGRSLGGKKTKKRKSKTNKRKSKKH